MFITLAMEMVCCSITSWIAVRSASAILSNSSMQQMPRSASTKAPPSRVISPVRGSRITAAVKPTPDDPRPVVYWPEEDRQEKAMKLNLHDIVCFNLHPDLMYKDNYQILVEVIGPIFSSFWCLQVGITSSRALC